MTLDLKLLTKVKGTILLMGESGTGKSTAAKKIYEESVFFKEKFVTVHLASMAEQLIESELFGHCKGAFTGAVASRVGLCEEVGSGTLFLDEIGELNLEGQKKLLYLLEERKFRPVGSNQEKIFRGRIIAATNRNLQEMVFKGEFRKDLYFRLMTFCHELLPFRMLPRKERKDVFWQVLNDVSHYLQVPVQRVTQDFMEFICDYRLPGNYRELKNLVEYVLFVGEGHFLLQHLPKWLDVLTKNEELAQENYHRYNDALEAFERGFLTKSLKKYRGGINRTSVEIAMSKTTLIAKIRKYGINVQEMKALAMVPQAA